MFSWLFKIQLELFQKIIMVYSFFIVVFLKHITLSLRNHADDRVYLRPQISQCVFNLDLNLFLIKVLLHPNLSDFFSQSLMSNISDLLFLVLIGINQSKLSEVARKPVDNSPSNFIRFKVSISVELSIIHLLCKFIPELLSFFDFLLISFGFL